MSRSLMPPACDTPHFALRGGARRAFVRELIAESLTEDALANPRVDEAAKRLGVTSTIESIRDALAIERFERMAS